MTLADNCEGGSVLTEYRNPDNPNIIVVPARKRTQAEIEENLQHEREISHLRGELMGLYQEIPQYEIRLNELQRIQTLIAQEAAQLQDELEKAEIRKDELEKILRK